MFETYRIFDTPIDSQIRLCELPLHRGGEPLIKVRMAETGQLDLTGFTPCHDWRHREGPLICRTARREAEYLLSFPDQVSYHIMPEGIISCIPEWGTGERLVRQLLLNQVLPRYLAHTGRLLLHASAVILPNGKTVAFLGESGRGKSTLAFFCQQNGAHFIDDDCILLRFEDEGISVTGGVPTIRLYPDSLHALGHSGAAFEPYVDYSDKQQMCLKVASAGTGPHILDALYLLNLAMDAPANDTVHIEPAAGQAAMMAILGGAFNLDPSDPDTMTRTFTHAANLLTGGGGLHAHHLFYPRVHALLPQVFEALLQHLRV